MRVMSVASKCRLYLLLQQLVEGIGELHHVVVHLCYMPLGLLMISLSAFVKILIIVDIVIEWFVSAFRIRTTKLVFSNPRLCQQSSEKLAP